MCCYCREKEELRVQTIYRISPASDHSFIQYLERLNNPLDDMSFYVLNQTKINRFLMSNETKLYKLAYFNTGNKKILNTYTDKLIDKFKDAALYSSKNNLGINTVWNSSLLKPSTKYSIAFLFKSEKQDGSLSDSEKKFFRSLGLDINKELSLSEKMGDNDYNFAVFDMDDYSGSNHTWARNPSLKISSMKN